MTDVVENINDNETIKSTQQEDPQTEPKTNLEKKIEPNPLLEKALKEKRNAMEKIAQLQDELQAKVDAELKAKEDWKSLSERYETEKNEWKGKYEGMVGEITKGHKTSALRKELAKLGADEGSLEFLLNASSEMLDQIKYDEEHRVVIGADTVAETIKTSIPKAFGKASVGVDHTAPSSVPAGGVDIAAYKQMSLEDRKKNMEAVYKTHGFTMRK